MCSITRTPPAPTCHVHRTLWPGHVPNVPTGHSSCMPRPGNADQCFTHLGVPTGLTPRKPRPGRVHACSDRVTSPLYLAYNSIHRFLIIWPNHALHTTFVHRPSERYIIMTSSARVCADLLYSTTSVRSSFILSRTMHVLTRMLRPGHGP